MALDSDLRIGSTVIFKFRSGRNVRFNPHTKDLDDRRMNSVTSYETDTHTILRVMEGPVRYNEYAGSATIYWRVSTPDQIFFWCAANDVTVQQY